MSNKTKINQLLQSIPEGVVMSSSWLSQNGYSPELIRNYKKSGWLDTLENGAVIRANDTVDYLGGVYTLQVQLNLSVHPAADTALELLGRSHYIKFDKKEICLFGKGRENLPKWFKRHDWEQKMDYTTTDFLSSDLGMQAYIHKLFTIEIPTPARAMMEFLYLTPHRNSMIEASEIMKGMVDLVPDKVQELLEDCSSVKVKRLFLYLAENSKHSWLKYIHKEKIDLGKGKRSFATRGKYIADYKMTVPYEIVNNDTSGI